ncbi:MAG: hypothetical protein F6K41_05940 [Symploca sp. SIO3E6]|nr:hypothetical protein [Caldora sp. SIO3E6]
MSSEHDAGELSDLFTDFLEKVKADNSLGVMEEVQRWTGDQPFLSQHLCDLILKHPDFVADGQEKVIIEQIIQENIIQDWENNTASIYLKEIISTILDDEERDKILNVYLQILQNRQVLINRSQEQEKLLKAGLVKEDNRTLQVSNAIYASIFSLEWVQQQLPDTAQPTPTNDSDQKDDPPRTPDKNQTTFVTRLGSGMLLLVLLIILIAYLFSRKYKNPAIADKRVTPTIESTISSDTDTKPSDKELFNNGKNHARNGDWLDMFGEFCRLSQDSIYFNDAKSKLDQWLELYENNIQIALETFQAEENDSCPVAEDILDSFPN